MSNRKRMLATEVEASDIFGVCVIDLSLRIGGADTPRTIFLSMTVAIHVPSVLRRYCDGMSKLELSAPTVRASLLAIKAEYPSLYTCVCDETGTVRRHVNVFVNTDHMRERDGLETKLESGDEVTILPAVSGG